MADTHTIQLPLDAHAALELNWSLAATSLI